MIKHFATDPSQRPLGQPEWPANPTNAPTLFAARQPLRKLRVLVDAELVATLAAGETVDKSTVLAALLDSAVVECYRYTDGRPPAGTQTLDPALPEPALPVYVGWAVAYSQEDGPRPHRPVVYATNPTSYTVGSVVGNRVDLARTDESQPVYAELDPSERADRRERDAVALQVASQAVEADVFVTERPYLHCGSGLISEPNVTVCTLAEAIPLIGLYLRTQHEFILPTGVPIFKFGFNRGLYYWVGARELLPAAWRWFAGCGQHATAANNDKLALLGGSLLGRVTRALQERDAVHAVLNLPSNADTVDDALSSLDTVLVLLMSAVDLTARVAHIVLSISGSEYEAGWQKDKWWKRVAAKASNLADVVAPGSPGAQTLTILRLLRNSVHGAALQGVQYLQGSGRTETCVGLPAEDEAAILTAMDALGGRASWGVRSLGPGMSHVEPGILVDRLFEAVVNLLNSLMKETPVESLPHVTLTADDTKPPVVDPTRGKFDVFSEWNRLAIRWQLGF